jgi:hypothetical protein
MVTGGEHLGALTGMAAIGTPLEHIAGALWTSTDIHGLGPSHRLRACREIAESPPQTRLTRMKGSPVRVRASTLKVLLRDDFCCRVRRRRALHYPEKGIGRAVTCREFAPKVLERLASSGGPRLWAWPPETESAHPTRFTHSVGRTG